MFEVFQFLSLFGIKVHYVFKGAGVHTSEEACKAFFDLGYSAVGKGRSKECSDFPISFTAIFIDELKRVWFYEIAAVVFFIESV